MQLAEAFVAIKADLSGFKAGMNEVQSTLQQTGKKMTAIGKDLATKVSLPLLALGGASFKMAADLEDAMGATEQIYGNASKDVQKWAKGLSSAYGIATGEALEYSNMMGTMLMNIGGLTEDQAAKQAATLIELAGDLTAMYGGTVDDAVRALTGSLKNNNTMLDNYGIAVNEAIIKAKALEMGLITQGQEMSMAAKQAATLQIITEQTTAAQGQAAREAEGASGSMRALKVELKNLSTTIGEVLLPIITPMITKLSEIIKSFQELSPGMQKAIVVIGGIAAAVGPVLIIFGQMALGLSGLIGLFAKLAPLFTGVGTAIGAFLISPLGLVVTAVAAVIAIGVALYKNWDTIKEKAVEVGTILKETFVKSLEFVMEKVNAIKDGVKEKFQEMLDFVLGLKDKFKEAAGNIMDGIKEGIKDKIGSVKDSMKDVAQSIRNFLPFSPAKEGPLKDLNKLNFGGTISEGIENGKTEIGSAMNRTMSMPSMGNASGGTANIYVDLDGRTIAQSIGQHLVQNVRVATGSRI